MRTRPVFNLLRNAHCLLLPLLVAPVTLSAIGLQFHQFPKPRLQPFVDFAQVLLVTPPIEEHRYGSHRKHETPRDETDASEPDSGHEQQCTVEREKTHGEYGDRASRPLPRGRADVR